MRILAILAAAMALLCTGADLHAAGAMLRGRVVDPSGGAIVHGTVTLTSRDTGIRISTSTDSSGAYTFQTLHSGEYILEAKAPGFGSADPKSLTVATNMHEVDLQLSIARVSTEVQVTATATAQTTDEQAKAIDIISAEEMAERQVYSVATAIRMVPGMRVEQLGGPGGLVKILTRGLPVYDTSLLVDGFRMRDVASTQGDATAYLGDLLVVNSDRVEVLRGTGSSLYGTGASAGSVNLVTDSGGGRIRGSLQGEGGGLGTGRGVARIAGGAFADRVAYTAGIAHMNTSSGVDGNDAYRNSSVQGFTRMSLTQSSEISARIFGANLYTQLNNSPAAIGDLSGEALVRAIPNQTFTPDVDDPDYSRSAYYVNGLVSFLQRIGNTASFRVTYQGLGTSRRNDDGPAGTGFEPTFPARTVFDGRLDTVQARTDIQAGRYQLITAGYEFERERYHDRSTDSNPSAAARVDAGIDVSQTSHSVFAQDQVRLLDGRFQVSLSGRIQGFAITRPAFHGGDALYTGTALPTPPRAYTGDGSVAYLLPKSSTKLRAHVGNGYRSPSIYERFGSSFYFGSFSAYGDPRLGPERVVSYDAGFDQYFANQRGRVRATYFYTQIQSAIVFDLSGVVTPATDPFGRFGGYRNTRGGIARGMEFGIDLSPTKSTRVASTYTYTKSQERESTLFGGSLRAYRIPDQMVTLQVAQRFGKRWDATFDLMTSSNYIFPFYVFPQGSTAFEFDGPVRADLSINYTHPLTDRASVQVYTRVENAFNRTYYEEGFRTPKAWAVGGLKFLF